MNKLFLLVLAIISQVTHAQNLVPNASFEEYGSCPVGISSIPYPTEATPYLTGWYKPTGGTSDYFNECATAMSGASVPASLLGSQEPRTGNAYVGMIVNPDYPSSGGTMFREYVQHQLAGTLVAGHRYFVNYWVSLGEGFGLVDAGYFSSFGIDKLGALFTGDYVYDDFMTAIVETPQIQSPDGVVYADTANWQEVSGIFTAAGDENWIVMGTFAPEESFATDTVYMPEDYYGDISYYFLDDVCVLDLDGAPGVTTSTDTLLCNAGGTVLSGRASGSRFTWDNGDTLLTRTVATPGTYWVRTLITDSCLIVVDTFRARVDTFNVPVNLGNDTALCAGDSLRLDAYSALFDSYSWSTGDTAAVYTVTAPGTYYVVGTSVCYAGSDTITITNVPPPALLLPGDTSVCAGIPVALGVWQEGMSYLWSTGADSCCITATDSGLYRVSVTNVCGEQADAAIAISYADCGTCVMMPDAFSPNGDGLNDAFSVIVRCLVKDYRLNIFNRWGQLVFSSTKPGQEWNGTYKGQSLDAGVYFYYLEATRIDFLGGDIKLKGDITLIR